MTKETLKALRDYQKSLSKTSQGFTTEDLCELLNLSDKTVRKLMKKMMAAGKLKRSGGRSATKLDGSRCTVPTYEML